MQVRCAGVGVLVWVCWCDVRWFWLRSFAWTTKQDAGASDQCGRDVGGLVGRCPQEDDIC